MTYVIESKLTADIVTLDEMKTWLKRDASFTDDDALIQALINSAVSIAEKLMNRDILTTTWINYRESFIEDLTLRRGGFQSVVTVEYLLDDVYQALPTTDFTVSIGGAFGVLCEVCVPSHDCNCNAVKITFKTGFGDNATSVPEDIKTAIKMIVTQFYANRGDCLPDGSSSCSKVPCSAQMILNNYRIIDTPFVAC